MTFARMMLLIAVTLGSLAQPAQAQYPYPYDETPRPYYEGPPRGFRSEGPPRGYRELPPPRYAREFGQRCRVGLRTDIDPRRYVCPIVRSRVVGRPCVCPPPRGYEPGPYLDGVVIN